MGDVVDLGAERSRRRGGVPPLVTASGWPSLVQATSSNAPQPLRSWTVIGGSYVACSACGRIHREPLCTPRPTGGQP